MSVEVVHAIGGKIKSSVQKMNEASVIIRGLKVDKALNELTFCTKKAAFYLKKVLFSALSNAQNNFDLDVDTLYVKEVCLGKDSVLKRFSARARGKSSRIIKHYVNVKVVLGVIK